MENIDKIKHVQLKAGVEATGVVTSKTWIAIYHFLFAEVPYDLNLHAIIKAVQQKVSARITGQATARTWNAV